MTLNTDANAAAVVADLGRRTGTTLTPIGAEALAAILRSEGDFDGGAITARNSAGDTIDAETWFRGKLADHPTFAAPAAKPDAAPLAGNRTQRAIRFNQTRMSNESKLAEAEEVAKLGNPWSTATLNRSRAGFITLNAPALAAKLKAQAVR